MVVFYPNWDTVPFSKSHIFLEIHYFQQQQHTYKTNSPICITYECFLKLKRKHSAYLDILIHEPAG